MTGSVQKLRRIKFQTIAEREQLQIFNNGLHRIARTILQINVERMRNKFLLGIGKDADLWGQGAAKLRFADDRVAQRRLENGTRRLDRDIVNK